MYLYIEYHEESRDEWWKTRGSEPEPANHPEPEPANLLRARATPGAGTTKNIASSEPLCETDAVFKNSAWIASDRYFASNFVN